MLAELLVSIVVSVCMYICMHMKICIESSNVCMLTFLLTLFSAVQSCCWPDSSRPAQRSDSRAAHPTRSVCTCMHMYVHVCMYVCMYE